MDKFDLDTVLSQEPFDWRCPFCGAYTCITKELVYRGMAFCRTYLEGTAFADVVFIVCPNEVCGRASLFVVLSEGEYQTPSGGRGKTLQVWQLLPVSGAMAVPDYVPRQIREDYEEACLVLDKSPKAAATLARRCLQGMIRDFWQVQADTLHKEIQAISTKVDPLTRKAIDSVRKMGNIGAHMERDTNVMITVEPNEARMLVWLIERLIKDWYIDRHDKEEALKGIAAMPDTKKPEAT